MAVCFNDALCPNPDCKYHTKTGLKNEKRWYEFHGYYSTKKGNVPRYKCKNCGKTFIVTLSSEKKNEKDYYDCKKIWELYRKGLGLKELAEKFQVDPNRLYNDIESYLK